MRTRQTPFVTNRTRRAFVYGVVLSSVALAGCNSGNPVEGSPAYKEGMLGNGSFLFTCDDSVACDRWSTNSAKDFPSEIATGSRFNLRFVAEGQEGGTLKINGTTYTGVTLEGVDPYVRKNPDGVFAALKPGHGTVVAKDASGRIIDYVPLNIVQPDSIVVYKADYKGTRPEHVEKVSMKVGEVQSFRTVAKYQLNTIAGSFQFQWDSGNSNVVGIDTQTRGVVNIRAKGEGETTLTTEGAGLPKVSITVQVSR